MAIEFQEKQDGRMLEVQVSGKLTGVDYDRFIPEVDRIVNQHGKISVLFDMHDFHGWDAGAFWADTKFAWRHYNDIDRLAVIGEKRWQKGMTTICRPFTRAKIRYFDHQHEDEARSWLQA